MKFKGFIQKYVLNNIGYKILALLFAFLAWLAILNDQDPTITKTITGIPVTVVNENLITDSNIYTIKSGDTASITISGRRSVVNNLGASNFEATADFEELSITNAVPITVSLNEDSARYNGQIEITQKTTMMVINLENVSSKTMSVSVSYKGTKPDDLVIDEAKVTPSFVKVVAPETILDSLSKVEAVISYSDITGSGTYTVTPTLVDINGDKIEIGDGVSVDTASVSVDITVSYIKEVPLEINYQGTPASGYSVTNIVKSFETVTLKGTKSALNGISRIALPSSLLDVSGENRNVSISVDVSDYLPSGVTLYGDNTTVVIMAQIQAD